MKKIFFYAAMLACSATLFSSCGDKKERQVKDFALNFGQKAAANQIDSLKTVYADIEKADSLALSFSPDSLKVEKTDSVYTVKFNNKVSMTVTCTEDGKMNVDKTFGLFVFPAEDLKFGKEVGGIKDGMSDVEVAEVVGNLPGLKSYLLEQYTASRKGAVTLSRLVVTKEFEYMMDTGYGYYTLTNTTDQPIKASDYTIRYEDWYMGPFGDKSEYGNMSGRDIPAGGSIRIDVSFTGHYGRSYEYVVMKTPKMEEFLSTFNPTGNEYPEYAKTLTPADSSAPVAGDGPYNLVGKIGKYPAHMTLDKGLKTGQYYYDRTGSGDVLKLKVVSYSKANGKIRIEEYTNKGENTGIFDGTLTADNFSGKMTVTFNGKTYDFDLKITK